MYPICIIKFSGVSDLQGVKITVFQLTLLVSVTTVLRYRAAGDAGNSQQVNHVRHLLPESVAQTLACSLINSRLDYCNSLL